MKKDYKLLFASVLIKLNDDNCKSIMNLHIKGLLQTDEFKNLPEWFVNHCYYTANLINELRDIVFKNENIISENDLNEYLEKRLNKDSNLNNLID